MWLDHGVTNATASEKHAVKHRNVFPDPPFTVPRAPAWGSDRGQGLTELLHQGA